MSRLIPKFSKVSGFMREWSAWTPKTHQIKAKGELLWKTQKKWKSLLKNQENFSMLRQKEKYRQKCRFSERKTAPQKSARSQRTLSAVLNAAEK